MHFHINMKRELIYKMYKMSSKLEYITVYRSTLKHVLSLKPQNIIKKYNK
jgi:hypothetical protein